MANVRWKDKADIATLAADDYIPVTDHSASDADKYCTPAEIKTYVETGTFTPGGTVDCSSNTLSGSAIAFTGGTIGNVTLGITGGAITNCRIDNININANSITSANVDGDITIDPNGTGDINLTTAGGYVVFTEGDIKIGSTALTATATELNVLDADSAMNIHSTGSNLIFDIDSVSQITLQDGKLIPVTDDDIDLGDATHEFKDIYSDGTIYCDAINNPGTSTLTTIDSDIITIAKTLSFDGTAQDLTDDGEIDAITAVTMFRSGAGARSLTIANGTTQGQIKHLFFYADGGGDATLSDAVLNFTRLVFANAGEGATLIWDSINSKWNCVGCTGTFTA